MQAKPLTINIVKKEVFRLQTQRAEDATWVVQQGGAPAKAKEALEKKRWWPEPYTGKAPSGAFVCWVCGRWPRCFQDLWHTRHSCTFYDTHPDANKEQCEWEVSEKGAAWLEKGKFVLPGYETLDPSRVGEIQQPAGKPQFGEGTGGPTFGGNRRRDERPTTPYEPNQEDHREHHGGGRGGGRGRFRGGFRGSRGRGRWG